MKLEHGIELKRYTTFKMGGIVDNLYTPETEQELIQIATEKNPQYYLGGGSNVIINNRRFDEVVNLREFNKSIKHIGHGEFIVGASVRLQKLIKTINDLGYGGIEYLFSVPGLIGGAVVMNAGRGKSYNACISDYISEVKVIKDGKVLWITREDCKFGYRSSIFQNGDYVILQAKFLFPEIDSEKTKTLREDRIELCRKKQDNSAPNFGTVFCESDKLIMQLFKYLPIGNCNGVSYSKKTANWMLNNGGSFGSAIHLIERVKKTHKILGKKCRTEVIIWE